ncbi:MAG TPA: DUF1592 domain-containing protein [Polyangiaceae bacterium]
MGGLHLAAAVGALFLAASLGPGCNRAPARSPGSAERAQQGNLIPARVRRLSNVEYERTVSELVGATENIAARLPPDVRQEGYTVNADQAVPAAWNERLAAVAREVAHRAVEQRLDRLAPCAKSGAPSCVEEWIDTLGRRAYRRPLDPAERSDLRAAFTAGAADGRGLAGGAEVVLTIVLQSPNLLYVTELGQGGPPGTVTRLTPYEIASALSYAVRGGPPDDELLAAASSGTLISADGRETHARRLLGLSETRHHFRRFVLEWLEVDGLQLTAKNEQLFPGYEALEPRMLAETSAFVDEAMVYGRGSIRALLDANFASVDPPMARFYQLRTWGPRASLAGSRRAGLVQQASFLAAHAHEDSTSPVKRGDFVMRKLLCSKVPRPAELGIEVKIPPSTSARTTRERFSAHVEDAACSSCHATLDALGYTFEGFDAMGAARAKENGKEIDTAARVKLGGEVRTFADSLELSRWLAREPAVSECFARHAFRYFSAQSDPRIEAKFLELRRSLPADSSDSLFEDLVVYLKSDLFIEREVRAP